MINRNDELIAEAKALRTKTSGGQYNEWDLLRRKYLHDLATLTGRKTIIFATDWIIPAPIKVQVAGQFLSISPADKDPWDEISGGLDTDEVDILVLSPGGSAEATESIVKILRARFKHIRYIIPHSAKSAATMLVLSGDQLVMDEVSELGPIDPQMVLIREQTRIQSPAQAILDQFEAAQQQIVKDPKALPAWVPIIRECGPSLLAECSNQIQLARTLVEVWLQQYMFAQDPDGQQKAEALAKYLSNHNEFLSHGRHVGIDTLQNYGVNVLDMRTDRALRSAVRDLHRTITLTFENTGALRLLENSDGQGVNANLQIQVTQGTPPGAQQPQQGRKSTKQPQLPRGQRQS